MPTYEYECASCEHRWEEYQQITEKPRRKCPKCGRQRARRLIGAGAAILFKGPGFYQTDYRSAEYKQKAKAEKTGSVGGSATDKANKGKSSSSDSSGSSNKE